MKLNIRPWNLLDINSSSHPLHIQNALTNHPPPLLTPPTARPCQPPPLAPTPPARSRAMPSTTPLSRASPIPPRKACNIYGVGKTRKDSLADIDLEPEFLEISHIRFVECLKYLGFFISWDLLEIVDVSKRIKVATKVFGAVQKKLYINTDISTHLHIRWFKDIVINVLLWG